MDEDDDIFAQLDSLGGNPHDVGRPTAFQREHHNSSAAYSAFDGHGQRFGDSIGSSGYGQPEEGFVQEPHLQLDSFDERLLRQPDYDSRQGQAALGRARLSLAPASRGHHHQPATQQTSFIQERADLSRFAFDSGESPHQSSPSLNASQRHPRPYGRETPTLASARGFTAVNRARSPPPTQKQLDYDFGEQDPSSELENTSYNRTAPAPQQHFASAAQIHTKSAKPAETVVVQGINLVPVRELPDRFRTLFPFPLFNAVQSKCFGVIYKTNDNFVVSAPTGSGKTALLELAVCRLINGWSNGSFKVVYMAPTKSLCSERQRDWRRKFAPLDLQCEEMTGDSDATQLKAVQHASIIVTTPEKWDSMTRKWKDHLKLMQMVKLMLIDEVHILNEDRGATLEAVVSRMKSVGSDVRFVALSATVPNSQDIATWLGKDPLNVDIPAPRERFGEEFRPVRLQKHVCGYKGSVSNEFAFDKVLNGKITDVIARWCHRKPIIVFCFTRKSCAETAKILATWWSSQGPRERYWPAPRERITVGDKDLRDVVSAGVGVHHGALKLEDRAAIEEAYLEGNINVICCTSTLAVGVNLPCHMVIIKNTVCWSKSGAAKEYSDLEVMQMLGRAGRPQFDDSAVAVIMTKMQKREFYEKMISGQEILESRLHLNLIDHLNAEIGLGTVNSISSAKKWLTGTFLYVRLKENPEHYKIAEDVSGGSLDEKLENICKRGLKLLEEHDLIRGVAKLQSTEFGDAMARYYIQFDTMKNLLALPPKAKISEILSVVSQAAEFKDVRFRAGEKSAYKELNKNNSIKFPIPVNIDLPAHKVSLVMQSVLGALELPTEDYGHQTEYQTCKILVFQHLQRLIRCVIDCQLYLEDSISARNALMLARSFGAHVWDDSPLHMKQLENIGIVGVRKLVGAGIKSIEELASAETAAIEAAVSRNPPFGTQVREKAKEFPRLRVSVKTLGQPSIKKGQCVTIRVKAEIGFMNEKIPELCNRMPVYVCLLADSSDGKVLNFSRISARKLSKGEDIFFSADLTTAAQSVRTSIMCDGIAGTQQTVTLRPDIPAFMFPTAKIAEENGKQQQNKNANTLNTSKRRAAAAKGPRSAEDDDEFGDAGINDDDLAAAAESNDVANIDDFDDSGNKRKAEMKKGQPSNLQPKTSKESNQTQSTKDWEPRQLDSGKWACKHPCSDKTKCKHLCCREGLDKKPKPPKPKEPKKNEAGLDPKQTQLDLTKTKKASNGTASTAPPASREPFRKHIAPKEAQDLNRLHNSIKTPTPQVPLLKDRPSTQPTAPAAKAKSISTGFADSVRHPDDDAKSSDCALDSLAIFDIDDDFDTMRTQPEAAVPSPGFADRDDSSDEMLDMPVQRFGDAYNKNPPARSGHIDLTPYSDDFGSKRTPSQNVNTAKLGGTHNVNDRARDDRKDIFVTGESSSSDPAASVHPLQTNPKRLYKDDDDLTSSFVASSKRNKSDPHQASNLSAETLQPEGPHPEMEGVEMNDDTVGGGSNRISKARDFRDEEEEREESAREWFEKEFGLDIFNLI